MVGRLTLDQVVGVRVPAPQPYGAAGNGGFSVVSRGSDADARIATVPICAESAPASMRAPVSRLRSILFAYTSRASADDGLPQLAMT
jgi:hypothetical protein